MYGDIDANDDYPTKEGKQQLASCYIIYNKREKQIYEHITQAMLGWVLERKTELKNAYRKHGTHNKSKKFLSRELIFSAIVAEDIETKDSKAEGYIAKKIIKKTREQMFSRDEAEMVMSNKRHPKTTDNNYLIATRLLSAIQFIFSIVENRKRINARTYLKINYLITRLKIDDKITQKSRKIITKQLKILNQTNYSLLDIFYSHYEIMTLLGENGLCLPESKKSTFLFLNLILIKYGYGCFLIRRNNKRTYFNLLKKYNKESIEYRYFMIHTLYQSMCALRDELLQLSHENLITVKVLKEIDNHPVLGVRMLFGELVTEIPPISYSLKGGYALYDPVKIQNYLDKCNLLELPRELSIE